MLRAEIVNLSEDIAMAIYWMVDGKRIPDEEYQEMRGREEMVRRQAMQQAETLLRQLTDSYRELTEFMEQNPGIVQPVNSDAEHMQQAIYQKLRQNLQNADAAPRCCWIKEDGIECRSPKLRTHDYCFAHLQMHEAAPKKFRLPAAEDANGIQLAIMEVQRALIDDEISEKKAGLLLYSLQIASTNLERTTFGKNPEEMVTDYVEDTPAEETPASKILRHGEELERSGDLVIGRSEQPGKILPHGEIFTAETLRRGESQVLPRMEGEAAAASGA